MTVLSTQYMPSVAWMAEYLHTQTQIDLHEHYQKMSLRNRTLISTPNGVLKLSVPLRHGRNQRRPVKEVQVYNQENWQALHFKSIANSYRKSPYFEFLEDQISQYYSTPFDYLWQANETALEMILNILQTDRQIFYTEEYIPQGGKTKLKPEDFPPYQQVFMDRQPFQPDLSVLDLIFCIGPQEAVEYLGKLYKEHKV